MFNNVLMTSLTTLGDTNELTCWHNRPFSIKWPEPRQQPTLKKDTLVTKIIKKKNKRNRTAYTTEQIRLLEDMYTKTKYVDAERRKELAKQLKVGDKCIKVWFQNRRMKEKKESSESSSDSSSESSGHEPVTPSPDTTQAVCQREESQMHTQYNYSGYTLPFEFQNNYSYTGEQFYANNTSAPGCSFQNDSNIYPTQYYPVNSAESYPSSQYTDYYNNCENGNEWGYNTYFNINEFQL
ncbi:unnamed protein product [Leptosia nina]|uniref:Homeobox domain-containing protein n=1 Tax=Leptosia nina TaxID=320188 RepID=A0AAV1J3L0_9NEOP